MTEQLFERCIRQMCEGDQDGLRQVYDAYLPYIYSICMNMLQNREDAEDVTSAFFIRLWNTSEQYKPGRGHKAYLATIARNMCIDYIRKNRREIPSDFSGTNEEEENRIIQGRPENDNSTFESSSAGFEDSLIESMTLKDALKTLSPSEREIINLKIAGDLTFREIAQITRLPMGTVTWRYREAIKKLRRYGYE